MADLASPPMYLLLQDLGTTVLVPGTAALALVAGPGSVTVPGTRYLLVLVICFLAITGMSSTFRHASIHRTDSCRWRTHHELQLDQ